MKKILLSLLTIFLVTGVFAQKQDQRPIDGSKATEKYSSIFHLNEQQEARMEKILIRRERNLSEIQKFKSENPSLFIRKRKSVDMGMNNSIRMMLDKEQMKVYREKQIELRKKRANKEIEMRKRNASQEEIDQILAEMYLIE